MRRRFLPNVFPAGAGEDPLNKGPAAPPPHAATRAGSAITQADAYSLVVTRSCPGIPIEYGHDIHVPSARTSPFVGDRPLVRLSPDMQVTLKDAATADGQFRQAGFDTLLGEDT